MKRWSKLQRQLYLLVDPAINFQIHCAIYKMKSKQGSNELPRYWITLGKEIIFDYPKQFMHAEDGIGEYTRSSYPFDFTMNALSQLIREYIDTPVVEIETKEFENDYWLFTDILLAADRRISVDRVAEKYEEYDIPAVNKVIAARVKAKEII